MILFAAIRKWMISSEFYYSLNPSNIFSRAPSVFKRNVTEYARIFVLQLHIISSSQLTVFLKLLSCITIRFRLGTDNVCGQISKHIFDAKRRLLFICEIYKHPLASQNATRAGNEEGRLFSRAITPPTNQETLYNNVTSIGTSKLCLKKLEVL